MGYTHYWAVDYEHAPADAFGRSLLDAKAIIDAAGVPLGGADGTGEPELAEGRIAFNGADPDDYETFWLEAAAPGAEDYGWQAGERIHGPGWHWTFCKTARRPYDVVIGALLLRLAHHYGDAFHVSTDGDEGDWHDAVALYRSVFDEDPTAAPWAHEEAA